jgi:hypothetical protein
MKIIDTIVMIYFDKENSMTNQEAATISFIGTQELKNWLAEEAHRQDRSVSSLLRAILEEAKTTAEEIAAQRRHETATLNDKGNRE